MTRRSVGAPGKGDSNLSRRKRLPIKEARAQAATKVGRPTEYEPRFAEAMEKWAAGTVGIERYTNRAGDVKWVYKDYPTFEGFADSIGVTRDTLVRWATETEADGKTLLHPEFTYSYARVLDKQAELAQIGGLSGGFAQNTVVLLLKNHPRLAWKERSEVAETVKHEFQSAEALEAIYNEGWERSRKLNQKVDKDIGEPRQLPKPESAQ